MAGFLSVLALAVGVAVGRRLSSMAHQRSRRASGADARWTGITVAQMLQRVGALMPLGVAVVDAHRDVVDLNERARELGLGRDRQLDDQAWKPAQQALAGGDVEFDLRPSKRSAGRSRLSVHCQARLLSEEDRRFAVVFAHDQSDYAEALLASADDSDTVRRFAEKVLVEANRLGDMVAELIELSRLQGAERLPNVTEVDVDSVVSEAISRHKVAADNADIEVRTDAPSGLRVLGDETLLVTALANLVSNAIAYSPRGSLVSISRRSCGDDVEIAVTDRGIGIALEDQERVFERFFRGDKARSRATGGSGLGLAIVKHIAANHNGSIGVWSKPGTGSTFTLSIPAYRNGEEMFEQSSGREVRPVRAERPERPERPARPARSEREEELSR